MIPNTTEQDHENMQNTVTTREKAWKMKFHRERMTTPF